MREKNASLGLGFNSLTQFLSSEQLCDQKSLDVALNIAGVGKIHSENLRLWSTLKVIQFEFEGSGSDGGNLCLLWLEILISL